MGSGGVWLDPGGGLGAAGGQGGAGLRRTPKASLTRAAPAPRVS